MEKLLVLLFVLLLAFSICACSDSKTELDMVSTSSNPNSSINETSRITEEDALEIASQYCGVLKPVIRMKTQGLRFLSCRLKVQVIILQ